MVINITRALWLFCAAALLGGASAAMAAPGFIVLKDRLGAEVRAYADGPEDARAGVLITHDYFGITESTKTWVERLGAQGYRVIAVDLYGGRVAHTDEQATQLMQAFQAQDRQVKDRLLQAGLDELKHRGRRIATLGFSMGGIEALWAHLNDPSAVRATAIVYGFGFDAIDAGRLSVLNGPVLAVTGALDEGSLQVASNWVKRSAELHQAQDVLVLPDVGHGYAQPLFNGGRAYNADAVRVTWHTVEDFLAKALRGPHR